MPLARVLLLLCHTLVVWWCVLAAGLSHAAPPAAGSVIQNKATASGEFEYPGQAAQPFTLQSNTVEVTVMPVPGARLDNDGLIETSPGSFVTWQHVLTNTGNITDTYSLQVLGLGGDSGEFTSAVLIHDRNGNGQRDATDPVIPAGGVLTLAQGASASLLVIVQTPSDALENDRYRLSLTAVSATQTLTRTDEALIVGPSLELTKQVSAVTAKQGDVLTYSLTIRNRNRHAVAPTLMNIDGAEVPRILVADPVPANVSLRAQPVYSGPGKLVYHVAETAEDRYVTVLPANPAQVDRIGIAYESFAGFQTDALVFDVNVLANAAKTTLTNQFRLFHRLGDRDQEVISPQVQTVVDEAGKTPTLVNKDSDYAELDLRIGLGDELFLEATCSACNTLSGRRDYLVIRVRSGNNPKNDGVRNAPLPAFYDANGMDEVIVTAYETGPNTGVFHVVAFGEDTSKTVPIGIPPASMRAGRLTSSMTCWRPCARTF